MTPYRHRLTACLGLILSVAAAHAQPMPSADSLVSAEVTTSTPTVAPATPFTLALTFKLAPGWHIYWLNPGDSGMATQPKLKLPEGWTAGNWQFPIPVKFDQPGGYVGYGYKDEVTLLVDITPPATFREGTAALGVEVDYLVCEAICLPGDKKLTATVSAGEPRPHRKQDFDVWASQLPLTPTASVPVTVEGSGDAITSRGLARREAHVRLPLGQSGYNRVEMFPLTPDGMEVRNITAEVREYGAVINMEAKLYAGHTEVPPTLRAIVVFPADSGRRVGYWVELPLK